MTKNIRKTISIFATSIMGISMANADPIKEIDFNPYGQINLGYMHGDTGLGSEGYIVNNNNSSSRVGAKLSGDLESQNITVGAHVELGYVQNPSSAVSPENKNISGEFKDRHLNVFLEGAAGRFSLGQGNGAANGNIEADLSGTNVVSFANLPLVGGGLPFVNKESMEEVTLKNSVSNQDFESRYSRLRYDAPSLGPVDLSVSQGTKSNSDVTEFGGRVSFPLAGQVVARLGYSTKDVGEASGDVETIGGSISWLHTSGFNLTGAYSHRTDDNVASPDSAFYWAKVGYRFNEEHAIDAHYAETKDLRLKGDNAETIGAGYVYKPAQWLDIYAGYRQHSLSGVGADYSNVNVAILGSRIKF